MPYPFPNWIQPPDLAGQYARGLQLGQQAAEEQARMQMQQEQHQRDYMLEQQRLQVTKAYQDQQIALRKQELQQYQADINIKTQDAARRLEGYNKFQAAINAGEDAVGAALKYLSGTGEAGGVGTIAAAYERERRMKATPGEPEVKTFNGHQFLVVPGEYGQRPQYHSLSQDPLSRQLITGEIRDMERDRDEVQKRLAKMEEENLFLLDPEDSSENKLKKAIRGRYKELQAQLSTMTQDIKNARRSAGGGAATPSSAPAPSEAPPAPGVRPWDAQAPGVGLQVPTDQTMAAPTQASTGFTGRVVAIRPKAAAPTAPAAPSAPAAMSMGYGASYAPATMPGAPSRIVPPTATPSVPGAAFSPARETQVPEAISELIPNTAPSPLLETDLTPFARGTALRKAQDRMTAQFQKMQPVDLVAAYKRIGVNDASYDPNTQTYYSPSVSGPLDREGFELQLQRIAAEKNLDPLQ